MEELIYASGAVATLTVNRPKALNALNRPVLDGLMEALTAVRGDSAVRVLIITGAGDRAFVAGADIAAMAEMGVSEGLEFTRLGHARARELIMTGEMFDARAAFEWGLASRVVAADQLLDEARKLAEKIAAKSGFALRQAKAALRAAATMELDAGLRYEQNAFGVCFGSADRVEGMQAFVAKRAAEWRHR